MNLRANYGAIAAAIAAFVGAFWAYQYLSDTLYSFQPLIGFVLGTAHGMSAGGGEALFVVASRFILGFGISWAPLTGILAIISGFTPTKD